VSDYPICVSCQKATNSLAGNPGRWPHRVGVPDTQGEERVFCGTCAALGLDHWVRTQSGAASSTSQWLWRVFNLGFPDGHEDSTNTWGDWTLISAQDAQRLAREDSGKRYEFVPYLPSIPGAAAGQAPGTEGERVRDLEASVDYLLAKSFLAGLSELDPIRQSRTPEIGEIIGERTCRLIGYTPNKGGEIT
jgi:hypothetical protein